MSLLLCAALLIVACGGSRFVSAGWVSGRVVWHVGGPGLQNDDSHRIVVSLPHLGLDDLLIEPSLLQCGV
jgi:hypothetical protein